MDAPILRWLLAPLAPEQFFAEHYERSPLVLRGAADRFSHLVDLGALDAIIGTHGLHHPSIKIAQAEEERTADQVTYGGSSRRIDPVKAARLFRDGATLIFPHLQERHPALRVFADELGIALSSHVQTNIYLTPPTSQGFLPHWDTHDVFILQVQGHKDWRFYDTKVELPLQGQSFTKDDPAHEPGPVSRSFRVGPGDVIYIPRGLMHAATTEDDVSLHITTGVMAWTWTKLLMELVAKAGAEDPLLRRNLPPGFARPEFGSAQRAEALAGVLRHLADTIDPDEAFDHVADELIERHRPPMGDMLRQSLGADSVTVESVVVRRPGVRHRIEADGESTTLLVFGERITFPSFAHDALLAALGPEPFAAGSLPGPMDAAGRLVLVRRLVREGVLVLQPQAGGS